MDIMILIIKHLINFKRIFRHVFISFSMIICLYIRGDDNTSKIVSHKIPVASWGQGGLLDIISEDTLVFDVGSTKLPICEALLNHPNRKNFLATHPMAGTEFSGPNAAVEGLYLNKNNIVCDIEKTNPQIYKKALRIFKMLNMNIIKNCFNNFLKKYLT